MPRSRWRGRVNAGKGFAVVASEVKSLASQTAKATEEIRAQIGDIQGATGQTVEAIRSIGATIRQMSEIATNVRQAAQGTNDIVANIEGVSRAASDTGAAASQVLSAGRGDAWHCGVTEFDALGVKVLVQHTAQDVPNMIEGEPLLPDDHRIPRLGVARGQTRRLRRSGESPRQFRKNMSPVAVVKFFPESRLRPPDSFMPYRNEGMSVVRPLDRMGFACRSA